MIMLLIWWHGEHLSENWHRLHSEPSLRWPQLLALPRRRRQPLPRRTFRAPSGTQESSPRFPVKSPRIRMIHRELERMAISLEVSPIVSLSVRTAPVRTATLGARRNVCRIVRIFVARHTNNVLLPSCLEFEYKDSGTK